jgi:hypothetical protein
VLHASSDFPNYDRNHNTDPDYWSDAELRTARQTVFHDRARPVSAGTARERMSTADRA